MKPGKYKKSPRKIKWPRQTKPSKNSRIPFATSPLLKSTRNGFVSSQFSRIPYIAPFFKPKFYFKFRKICIWTHFIRSTSNFSHLTSPIGINVPKTWPRLRERKRLWKCILFLKKNWIENLKQIKKISEGCGNEPQKHRSLELLLLLGGSHFQCPKWLGCQVFLKI